MRGNGFELNSAHPAGAKRQGQVAKVPRISSNARFTSPPPGERSRGMSEAKSLAGEGEEREKRTLLHAHPLHQDLVVRIVLVLELAAAGVEQISAGFRSQR